jgi:CheY-like chemotaxis protein
LLSMFANDTYIIVEIAFKSFSEMLPASNDNARLNIFSNLRIKIANAIIKELGNKAMCIEALGQSNLSIQFSIKIINDCKRPENKEQENEIPEEGEIELPRSIDELKESIGFIDILVVDDYEMNLMIVDRLISQLASNCKCKRTHKSLTVHFANSGKQALEKVLEQEKQKGGYKVVIMDCQMPEMDGWETTLAIFDLFSSERIRNLPYIIAYSAFDSSNDIEKCDKVGMSGHISKPCSLVDMCDMLRKYLEKPIRRRSL